MTLPPLEVPGRLDRLRAALPDAGVDALIVTNLANVRYLTGFTGSVVAGSEACGICGGGPCICWAARMARERGGYW